MVSSPVQVWALPAGSGSRAATVLSRLGTACACPDDPAEPRSPPGAAPRCWPGGLIGPPGLTVPPGLPVLAGLTMLAGLSVLAGLTMLAGLSVLAGLAVPPGAAGASIRGG